MVRTGPVGIAGSRLGLSRPVPSSVLPSPLWESRNGRGWFYRSLQTCWVSEAALEVSTSTAEGWDQWKAMIILRWAISPLKGAGCTSTSALGTGLSEWNVELEQLWVDFCSGHWGSLSFLIWAVEKTEQDHVCKGLTPGPSTQNSSINGVTQFCRKYFLSIELSC